MTREYISCSSHYPADDIFRRQALALAIKTTDAFKPDQLCTYHIHKNPHWTNRVPSRRLSNRPQAYHPTSLDDRQRVPTLRPDRSVPRPRLSTPSCTHVKIISPGIVQLLLQPSCSCQPSLPSLAQLEYCPELQTKKITRAKAIDNKHTGCPV